MTANTAVSSPKLVATVSDPSEAITPWIRRFAICENMYLAAPINELYKTTVVVSDSTCTIEILVDPQFFHAADALEATL